ncbi:prepilin peptidase [Actinoplanes aureus]|uniref:Prepilin peptidase n=1 Tax=Actinoplanes aureus TaxID=2792083 RepID=A0A931CJ91_9ACTN|nr:prepilin peptidase [Actinoplanes aureus]MBG0569012.1 prepilin peptidase [Actinoplanes aureus]
MWLLVVQASTLLSLIDVAARRLPMRIVRVVGLVVALGASAAALLAGQPMLLLAALLGAIGLGGFYLLIALSLPGKIGWGDVRLAAVLGAALGTIDGNALVLGLVLAYVLVFPFALILRRRPTSEASAEVPFGPFLASGAIIAAIVAGG